MFQPLTRLLIVLLLGLSLPGLTPQSGQPASPRAPVLAPPGAQDFEILGYMGGSPGPVELHGTTGYAVLDHEFAILDISAPAHPQRTGYVLIDSEIMAFTTASGYAYLMDSKVRLWAVSLADPAHPAATAVVNLPPEVAYNYFYESEIVVLGGYAYVAAGSNGLLVYDLADPANPRFNYVFGTSASSLAIQNDRLYLLGSGRLVVLDISSPGNFVEIASLVEDGAYGEAVVANGDYAYLIWQKFEPGKGIVFSLKVMDISAPDNLVVVNSIELTPGSQGLFLDGTILYVKGDSRIQLFDISRPDAPVSISTYTTEYRSSLADMAVDAGLALLSDSAGRLWIVNITDPHNPQGAGRYDILTLDAVFKASGKKAYVTSYEYHLDSTPVYYFNIIDFSDFTNPQLEGRYQLESQANDAAISGSYAYLTGGFGLRVVDISDPANPAEVGTLNAGKPLGKIRVNEPYAYVLEYNRYYFEGIDFMVIDITDPTSPALLGSLHYPSMGINNFDIEGQYAYLADYGNLEVVDLSNPNQPVRVSSLSMAIGIYSVVEASEQRAYVGKNGFYIIDISTPTDPQVIGEASVPQWAHDMAIDGNRIYITSGLHAFDVTNPASPQLLGSYPDTESTTVELIGEAILTRSTILRYSGPSISGQVLQANRLPYPGVTISNGITQTLVSPLDASYRFSDLESGSYTVSPSLPGYAFQPAQYFESVPPSAVSRNFTILAAPVSAAVDPGLPASLVYTDTQGLPTSLSFPAGAFTATTTVAISPTLASAPYGWFFSGHALDLAVDASLEATFTVPATLTIQYSNWDVWTAIDEGGLAILRWDGTEWQDASGTCAPASEYERDLESNTLSLRVCRAGRYALFVPVWTRYLPVVASNFTP